MTTQYNLYPCITIEQQQTNILQANILPCIASESIYNNNNVIQQNISSLIITLNNYNVFTITHIDTGATCSFLLSTVLSNNIIALNKYKTNEHYITQQQDNNNNIQAITRYCLYDNKPELLIVQLKSGNDYNTINTVLCIEYCINIDNDGNISIDTNKTHIVQVTPYNDIVSNNRLIQCMCIDSNNDILYVCTNESIIEAYNINAILNPQYIKPLFTIDTTTTITNNSVMNGISCCYMLQDCVVVGSNDNTIKLYDTNTKQLIHQYNNIQTNAATCILPIVVRNNNNHELSPTCPNIDTSETYELLCIGTIEGNIYILSLQDMNIYDIIYNNDQLSSSITKITYNETNNIIAVGYTNGYVMLYQISTISNENNNNNNKTTLIGSHKLSDYAIVSLEYNVHNNSNKYNELIVWCYNNDTHLFTADDDDFVSNQPSIRQSNDIQQQEDDDSNENNNSTLNNTLLQSPPRQYVPQPTTIQQQTTNSNSNSNNDTLTTPQPIRILPRMLKHSPINTHINYHHKSHINQQTEALVLPYSHTQSPVTNTIKHNKTITEQTKQVLKNPKRVQSYIQQQYDATKQILDIQKNSSLQLENKLKQLQLMSFDEKQVKQQIKQHDINKIQQQSLNVARKQTIFKDLPKIDNNIKDTEIENKVSNNNKKTNNTKRQYVKHNSDNTTDNNSSNHSTSAKIKPPQLRDTYIVNEREMQYGQLPNIYNNADSLFVPPIQFNLTEQLSQNNTFEQQYGSIMNRL